MKKKNASVFPMTEKEAEYMRQHHPELIVGAKRRHRNIEIEGKPKKGYRFTGEYPTMAEDECSDVDLAINKALIDYADEYNRLPDSIAQDERKRIKSRLESGIEALELIGDSNTAEILEDHLMNLKNYAVTKNELLKLVRESIKYDCRRLGDSFFDKIASTILEYFQDEAPDFNKKRRKTKLGEYTVYTFDEIVSTKSDT